MKGAGGGRSLAINAHLDVVPVGRHVSWTHPPFSGFVDEERDVIYGRGAMDDKAGVVVALATLEMLANADAPLAGDVVFHFVLEDETTGNGTLLCLEHGFTADAALIIDGTRLAARGSIDTAVTRNARCASPEKRRRSASRTSASTPRRRSRRCSSSSSAAFTASTTRHALRGTSFPVPFSLVTQSLASRGEALTLPETAEARVWITFPPPVRAGGDACSARACGTGVRGASPRLR